MVNRQYGFYDAVQHTLGEMSDHYWATFAQLPLAAVSPHLRIFAVHGGIPEQMTSIDEINGLPREVEIEHPVTFQLLWNDPQEALKGFAPSFRGGRARNFGQDVTIDFMARNNLDLIVRAHEVFPHGFHEFFEGRILSLFSCRKYRGSIAGKAFRVDEKRQRELIPI
jgi:diadenosine tetraphosphatase ApaH/serine/threonine PP2A family protein phosphatase